MERHEKFYKEMDLERISAKIKHPTNEHLLPALTEEVGELAHALLQIKESGADCSNVYKEAIQVATLAMRIATTDLPEFNYKYADGAQRSFNF